MSTSTLCYIELEQLECLRSGDTPADSWLPIVLGHIGSQVKRRQSQSYKLEEFFNVETNFTPYLVAW